MSISQAQTLLRQQLSFAKMHLGALKKEQRVPQQRSLKQAYFLALELGFKAYLQSIFGITVIHSLTSLPSGQFEDDYRKSELFGLLSDDESWLYQLSSALDEIKLGGITKPVKSNSLIASSHSAIHWHLIELDTLDSWLSASEEFLQRHSSSDQEF